MTDLSLPCAQANPETAEAPSVDHNISGQTLLRYGVGMTGAQVFRDAPATLLPIFLTTMLGVPAWVAGFSILIPKLWIIFCDPLMGAYSDRKKTSWGRAPFLLAGSILTAIGFFFLFTPPDFSSYWMFAAYNVLMFALASTGFSVFCVPYLAMASEMTDNYNERTRIMAYRMGFTGVGVCVGVGFVQPLVIWFGGGRHGYTMMALTLSALCLATMMATYFGMRRFPLIPTASQTMPLFKQFRMAASYKPFAVLASAHFVQQLGQAASYTVVGLVFLYVIQKISLIIPFVLVMTFFSITSQPLWIWVSRRFGKGPTYVFCVLGWVVVTFTWFWVGPADDILFNLPFYGPLSAQDVLVLLRAFVIGLFNAGFLLLVYSMLTDTIEYDRRQFGFSREGVFSGMFSAIEKLSFAVGPAIAGIVLSVTGFVESRDAVALQDAGAIRGILFVYGGLPVIFATLGLLIFRFYSLNEERILAVGAP
jgi:GPH family glycoside/pentoside/hexuronide:cation symporter